MSRFFAAAAAFGATLVKPELEAAVPYVKAALDEYPHDLEEADPVKAVLETTQLAYQKMRDDPAVRPSLTAIMVLVSSAAMNGFRAYLSSPDEPEAEKKALVEAVPVVGVDAGKVAAKAPGQAVAGQAGGQV